ncbi:MAG: FecR domain-containing protein [Spirochaetales bacterium]|nr:FecR domain-containing protein [Spirochaetales bacterium]MCF7938175.1 FecR domain-containing protein [Spirochaetales bacterium]
MIMQNTKSERSRQGFRPGLFVIAVVFTVLAAAGLAAQEADVVYVEGYVDTKTAGGDVFETYIGDYIRTGDSIITGGRGYAELEQGDSAVIKVSPDTVFTLQEREVNGEKRQVMATTAGSVFMRFNKLTGKEPMVQSSSYVAGVRGTEFTVYSGSDGSSMILVDKGAVEVTAEGESVNLGAEQGVEVAAGAAPGEVFEFKGRELDFSTWNQQKEEVFLENPVQSLKRVQKRLEGFQKEIEMLYPEFVKRQNKIDVMREELTRLREEEGQDAMIEYRDEFVTPYIKESRVYILNTRYYALSALSLRRFVLGSMYLKIKTAMVAKPDNKIYRNFMELYEEVTDSFEDVVVPQLVEADI